MGKELVNRLSELKRPSADHPRQFVPDDAVLSSWEAIKPYYDQLLDSDLNSAEEVEQWILDLSELEGIVDEEGSRRYIAMTCATDNEEVEKAYLDFVENIEPHLKQVGHKINLKLLDSPYTDKLDQDLYFVYLREIRNQIELFREENVPLQTELGKLSQQYQKIMGAMTVQFRGEEMTLQQVGKFLESDDRDLRFEAWKVASERRLEDTGKLEDIFDEMLKLRHQIAQNAGFDDFRAYQFRVFQRFDYTPQDCLDFHDSIEKWVVPINKKLNEERKASLGLDSVRPWDGACDRLGRKPQMPFDNTVELAEGCRKIFGRIDKELGDQFQQMIDIGVLDLDSRKGKAPGGYQASLGELRLPFIFMNAVGTNGNLFTLLHEGGHAFHQFAVQHEPIGTYRHSGMEFAEVASMSMEHLAGDYLDEFYSAPEAARAWRSSLEGDVSIFPWIAIVDAFQHWIYTHPEHTREERADHWVSLMNRFSSGTDWTGYDDALKYRWHAQLHIFEYPFYYIDYAIALLGALQVWRNSLSDKQRAVNAYKTALKLGGSKKLPELFEAAEIEFDFTDRTIKPLMAEIQKEIEKQGKLEN